MKKRVFVGLLASGIALAAAAESPQKAAWKWTLEQRLDARFAQTRPAAADGWRSITGKENPELLLPTELFKNLVELTLAAESPEFRAHFREKFRLRAKAVNLGDDFFEVLERLSREYVTESVRIRQLSKQDAKEGAAAQSASALARCALVARALADVRKHYGEAFDRFLYEAVALDTNVSTDMNRDRLLAMERGCP
jgi:hypothetical protein